MAIVEGVRLRTDDQRSLVLGRLVKSGGAGSVFLVNGSPDRVAKIYHPSVERSLYQRKIRAMLRLSPQLPDLQEGARRYVQIAWPQSLLNDESGRFVGFTMPAVDIDNTSELELILQERQARAAQLPTGLGAKITLAANLAAVIAALHRLDHYVVDLKPVNLRFYKQSLYMAMLDCDGFSIQGVGERFAAPQVTPDYLAPEFQLGALNTNGEEAQDRFALAAIVFQLLNFGLHPYSGRPASERIPTDIPGRIAGGWYAHGMTRKVGIEPSPVSGHAAMPTELRLLFDRAFQRSGRTRPSAAEWTAALVRYAQRSGNLIVACTKDRSHQHFSGFACATCARASLIKTARATKPIARSRSRRSRVFPTAAARIPPPHRKAGAYRLPANPVTVTAPTLGSVVMVVLRWMWRYPRAGIGIIAILFMAFVNLFDPERTPQYSVEPVAEQPVVTIVAPQSVVRRPFDTRDAYSRVTTLALSAARGDAALFRSNLTALRPKSLQLSDEQAASLRAFNTAIGAYHQLSEQREWARDSVVERQNTLRAKLAQILSVDPTMYSAASELGWIESLNEDCPAAESHFIQSIWAFPDQAEPWYGLALCYFSDGASDLSIGTLAISMALEAPESRSNHHRFQVQEMRARALDAQKFNAWVSTGAQRASELRPLLSSILMKAPAYPHNALTSGVEGIVTLILDIDATGKVTNAWVERSSRNRDLDRAALEAAKAWSFNSPAQRGRQVRVPVEFLML